MAFDLDRILPVAPASPLDDTGAPRIGAYAGSMESVDLGPLRGTGLRGRLRQLTKEKRWTFVMLTSREVVCCFAIVDLTYASNCFIFVADRNDKKMIVEKSFLGLPGLSAHVAERPGAGARASFSAKGAELHIERVGAKYLGTARVDDGKLSLNFTLDTQPAAPAVTLIVPVQGGILNCTQKWSGLPAHGSLVVGDKRYDLDGGFGGMDYTYGLLARETIWRWGFASGLATDGTPVGFNVGEGVNSAVPGENALWHGNQPCYLPDVRFTFDRQSPLDPWRIQSDDGSVDLRFTGVGFHREARNLVVAASKFVQVAGEFSGKLRGRGGKVIEVSGLPGVVEDQFVRW